MSMYDVIGDSGWWWQCYYESSGRVIGVWRCGRCRGEGGRARSAGPRQVQV